MSTMVQMDVPLGHQTAKAFTTAADEVQGIVSRVEGQVSQLEATWKGTSHDRFMGEYPGWQQDMKRFIQLLQAISQRIEKETTEIEQADQAY
jgi:WXG100 family type VII secretion target